MSVKGFSVNGAVEQYDYNALANKPTSTGLSDEAKQALLACFENVAWINEDGQSYVDALEAALYPPANLVSISAVYTQSGTVYGTDTLDSLKADLVVTANYDNGTTQTVTAYTLSGTLTEGTSTITVSYGGKTTTFDVVVSDYKYSLSLSNDDFHILNGSVSWDDTHDIYTNTATSQQGKRRAIYIDDGVKPYNNTQDNTTFIATDMYPIPVPPDATSCTYAITPNTQFIGAAFYTFDPNANTYNRVNDVGWRQGSYTLSFSAGAYSYATFATKYDGSGASYPTEPTELIVEFGV